MLDAVHALVLANQRSATFYALICWLERVGQGLLFLEKKVEEERKCCVMFVSCLLGVEGTQHFMVLRSQIRTSDLKIQSNLFENVTTQYSREGTSARL